MESPPGQRHTKDQPPSNGSFPNGNSSPEREPRRPPQVWVSKLFQKRTLPLPGGAFTLACILVGIVLALRGFLIPWFQIPLLILFVPAILVPSTLGGFRVGLFSTLVSCVCAALLILPHYSWQVISTGGFVDLASLSVTGVVVAGVCGILRNAIQQSEEARADLGRALILADQLSKEQADTESKLRSSLERLERVLDNQTVGAMFWDLDTGAMIDANEAFFKLLGYSRADVEARALFWWNLTPPEFMEVSQREVDHFLKTGRVGPFEKQYFCKDGTRKWLLFAGSSLGGNQCVEFCVDISERKKAEQALVESETRLRAVLDALPVAVMFTEPNGDVSMVNRAVEQIWGAGAPLGRLDYGKYQGWWPSTGRRLEVQEWPCARALRGETSSDVEVEIESFEGERKIITIHSAPLSGPQGENFGALTVQQDITERKDAEQKLRDAQERLNIALAAAQMGTWEWHMRDNRSLWNAQMYRLLGLEEGGGVEPTDVYMSHVHPDDLPGLHESVANLKETDWRYEHRIIRTDGEVRWVVELGRIIRDPQGLPEVMYGVTYDVTSLKRAEAEAKASRDRLAAAMGSMSDGVFITDTAHQFVHVNDAFAHINRFSSLEECLNALGELSSHLVFLSKDGEELPRSLWPFDRAINGESVSGEEYIVKRKDTGESWIASFTFAPIRYEREHITGMVATERDVTQRMRAEEALRQSEQRYRMLHETMRDAFVQMELDGKILDFNDVYRDMLNYADDELRSLASSDITPERWQSLDEAQLKGPILQRGYSDVYEKEYLRKDGSVVPVELRFTLSRTSEGDPESIWAIVRDLTERKRYEQHLRTMRDELAYVGRLSELGQVSAGIAHELNQPLAAMMNYSNVAKRLIATKQQTDLDKAHDAIAKATDQALRAGVIIRRMRGFIEKRETIRAVEDVNVIIDDAVALCAAITTAHDIEIDLRLARDLPQVCVDRVQIQQVLVNLIRNAVEAMAEAPHRLLIVATTLGKNSIEVSLKDTGPGLSKEVAERAFMPFFTTKPGGMGIGLVICRSIIEAHGGVVAVTSVPGHGAAFHFELPVASVPENVH